MISKNEKQILSKTKLKGQVGESAIWDGPLDLANFPKGKGASNGANGMEVLKFDCGCNSLKGPITSRAKAFM
tara:strand:+ start:211 stop:426 length:216 start_codon:yes stop_codon:yes gene_type:complete